MKLPGFLTPLGLQLAGIALVLVFAISLIGGNRIFSPGLLSAVNRTGEVRGGIDAHADLNTTCEGCHTAPWSSVSMNDRCINCHTDIQRELAEPSSLHGILQATDCRECHTEHRGEQGYLTQIARLEIDHNRFGFSLAAHPNRSDGQPFACADCHTASLARFEPTQCESCHRIEEERFTTLHISEFGAECRACHDGTDNFSKERFDHNQLTYPLLGKHADVRCVDCHVGVRSLASFKDAPTDCVGCHQQDNPHPANFGIDCASCHNTEGWDTEIFDHNLSVFKLTGKHTQVPCKQCHINDVYRGTPTTCASCHQKDDVHRGLFGTECQLCHTPDTWLRGPFEHTFPLDHGGLGPIACATCHTNPGNYQEYTCYNCHNPDDIRRQHAFSEMMETNITDCARCHPTGKPTMQMH